MTWGDEHDHVEGDEPEPVEDLDLRACPCHDNPGDGRAVIYYWSGFQRFLLVIGAADAEDQPPAHNFPERDLAITPSLSP